ncbi:MAG: ACP S-malonyltransferase, partial [Isosphaeraceae bacterium]
ELAQVSLLREFFGVEAADARQSFGYSIGEMAALIVSGVFTAEHLLPVPLACAADCADLTENSTVGVLFSRGPALPLTDVQALCCEISSEGLGMVGVSAYLSPNTAVLHGEGETLTRLAAALPGPLPKTAALRLKTHKLPPLHTPIVWQRNIPNRVATALYKIPGRLNPPDVKLLSCVTGEASYDPGSARDLMVRWVDHPQLLWNAIDETLRGGVDTLIHVGPGPNLIPATFQRLGRNVEAELNRSYFGRIGREFGSRVNRHAWLARLLPGRAALLRAPGVRHVILEDWLLEQESP